MNPWIEHGFELLGVVFEVIGGLYLANRYLIGVRWRHILPELTRITFSHQPRAHLVIAADLTAENIIYSLRGIFFIIVGFVIKAAPHLVFFLDGITQRP